jgi:hypothetical protein
MAKPLHLRKLRAEMVLKELTITALAKRTKLHVSMVSELLSGARHHPHRLSMLQKAIERAPQPEGARP